ncbi:hypothetical protein [Halocatena marina]|uniref:hypothetical protein n=1 Tax=Halocatena marina TaxID=2934937 RepID=UPI0036F29E6C
MTGTTALYCRGSITDQDLSRQRVRHRSARGDAEEISVVTQISQSVSNSSSTLSASR